MNASRPSSTPAKSLAISPERCPLCGGPNHCALVSPSRGPGSCWCMKTSVPLELLVRVPEEARHQACICRECATKFSVPTANPEPLPIGPGDFYFEAGRMIFTAAYHRRRGYCCGNGCRHCPYPG